MKKNGNNKTCGDYYLGLDIGTNSVGWAVTDSNYNICRFKGNSMWGIRLFDEGDTAEGRRSFRSNRRRLARRKQRIELLKLLFNNEISKIDPSFYQRMADSFLQLEHKSTDGKYSLFNDLGYCDIDYMKQYKTIYHLRQELIHSAEPHDVRLVYLAIHHIMKNRGHFLFDVDEYGEQNNSFEDCLTALQETVHEYLSFTLEVNDRRMFHSILLDDSFSKKERAIKLKSCCVVQTEDITSYIENKKCEQVINYIVGLSTNLSILFDDPEIEKKIKPEDDLESESLLETINLLGDRVELLLTLKALYDCVKLEKIMGTYKYLSDYKVAEYNEHKKDIQELKKYLVSIDNKKLYKKIFTEQKSEYNNYPAYTGYKKGDKYTHCSSEEFCKFLKTNLPGLNEFNANLYQKIENNSFAKKLRTSDNSIIPNGLHRKELRKILENASAYLPFLTQKDVDGLTISEKIISIFDFKIPYYVGPLNSKSKTGWVIRKADKIYPWNFRDVVDEEKSAEMFIVKMTGKCTYTGDDVLPKDSLLYSEFLVLNEINNIQVNKAPINRETKELIYNELFKKYDRKFSKKDIHSLLLSRGLIQKTDTIEGVADKLKSSLSSYHKLSRIREVLKNDDLVEDIIKRIVLFGDDKRLLRIWIKKNIPVLTTSDINYLSKLKFKEWGALSKSFLHDIQGVDYKTGELMSIIDALRVKSENIMELLSSKYSFYQECENYRKEKYEIPSSPYAKIENLYVSPKIKRSIRQTMRIVDEIVDIKKSAPKKIFIEVARDQNGKNKKEETSSRKAQLIQLYKQCNQDAGELWDSLCSEEESKLRQDKLYFYYIQFGKCMYSGKPIPLDELQDKNKWDIDHIYPRSKIKDDSLDNRVLVDRNINQSRKKDDYPVPEDIRNNMRGRWDYYKKIGVISETKHARLIRHTRLTEAELSQFVNRQLVETRQSTKAIAELFKDVYGDAKTKIVYSKAGNISDFRKHFNFLKCRDINDLHHAKDAYLNIVVGNFFDTKFTEEFFKNIYNEKYSLNLDALYAWDVPGAWISGEDGTIETVTKFMNKNNVLFTRMPYERKGQLYDVTIMKKESGQVPIKQGLDTKLYGGYNKAAGAYFVLVEHTEKKKTIRTLEAILVYQKNLYEKNPITYFESLGLKNPKIIVDKILIDSVLELDGVRLNLSGRQNSRIILKHMHQLVLSSEENKMIRNISKYVSRCTIAKRELTIHVNDNVSSENNNVMYDFFLRKLLEVPAYKTLFSSMIEDLCDNRNKFISMSIYEQCKLIMEILKAFKCNSEKPSFKELCGKGTVGAIVKSKNISSFSSAYIINQSITGLYETRINLLE